MGLSDGLLTQKEHYNPQWRIDGVRVKGLNGLYTERSQGYYFDVGQGVVGKVFAKQEALFVSDLQALDMESVKDAMQSGNGTEFLRASLAKEFDLRSAVFLPVPDGVLEVGSLARMTALPQYFEQYVSTSTFLVADTQPAQQSLREPTEQPPVVLQKLVEEFFRRLLWNRVDRPRWHLDASQSLQSTVAHRGLASTRHQCCLHNPVDGLDFRKGRGPCRQCVCQPVGALHKGRARCVT